MLRNNLPGELKNIHKDPLKIVGGYDRVLAQFVVGDTTPSVLNQDYWECMNTGAVTITQFEYGYNLQTLKILGDGFTTIANNANIKTNTGANKLLAVNKVYTFTLFNGVWVENA